MDSGANAMHEMFLSYMGAGFTEDQALKLIALIISNAKVPEEGPNVSDR